MSRNPSLVVEAILNGTDINGTDIDGTDINDASRSIINNGNIYYHKTLIQIHLHIYTNSKLRTYLGNVINPEG